MYSAAVRTFLLRVPQTLWFTEFLLFVAMWRRIGVAKCTCLSSVCVPIFAHRDVHAFPRRAPPDVIKSKYVVGKYKYVLLLLVTIMLSTIPLSLVAAIGVAQDTIHLIVRAVYGLFAVGFAIIGTVSAYKLDKRLTPAAATPKPATRSVTQPSSVGEQRKGSEPIDMCVWRCVVSVSCSVRRISCALLLRPFRTASMPPDGKPGRPRKRSG